MSRHDKWTTEHQDPPSPPRFKKGDWYCKMCNFHNFSRNTSCLSCGKGTHHPLRKRVYSHCVKCDEFIMSERSVCYRCDKRAYKGDKSHMEHGRKRDWKCEGCGEIVFSWRKECRFCGPLIRCRLAFLAAWHPRAGNPLMIKYIPKNVTKLIVKKYTK